MKKIENLEVDGPDDDCAGAARSADFVAIGSVGGQSKSDRKLAARQMARVRIAVTQCGTNFCAVKQPG